MSHSAAKAHCESEGLRLCTEDEVKNKIGEGTGCSFNAYQVWTSTICDGTSSIVLILFFKSFKLSVKVKCILLYSKVPPPPNE